MALTKGLNGLIPDNARGAGYSTQGDNRYRIKNTLAANIFYGDIVKISLGNVETIAASTDFAAGVFVGCHYVDPNTKQPQYRPYWPSGTSSADSTPYALVVDDPRAVFVIQCDATVTANDVMRVNYDTTLGAGNTLTGQSGQGLMVSSGQAASAMLRILDIYETPDNNWGDPFPKVLVRLVQHVDARLSAT